MRQIYLDHNATTAIHPLVVEAMQPYLHTSFGNPSSVHWAGRSVRNVVEEARKQVARLVNCEPEEVVFTSCATESNNTAIKGVAVSKRMKGKRIITTAVEHPSVLMPCYYLEHFGFAVDCFHVDGAGRLDLNALAGTLTEETILLSVMYANNETGTIFPVQQIGELAARRGVCFHCDAAQAVGKIPVDFKACNIDLMSFSGHKFYAPKGVGALIVRQGVKLPPLLHGGSQERNRRAGTENVAGIVGLGKACEIAADTQAVEAARLQKLRDRLEQGILAKIPDVRPNGDLDHRLPNTTNLSFLYVDSDALLSCLDQAGIAVSSVSACSSGTLKTSRVLEAMGVAEGTPMGTLRFSLGRANNEADVIYVLEVLPEVVKRLRQTLH
ncbi:cysteine desulfurase NifS [Syntrophotalea acetylenivorans]|uniref:cysteine desulfurase n=1 Tax=Syntrophotalea acetylenivorans TaxID=1842532 RepID=A0A1L3GMK9_9BACT|nr:aminotransferase class V-fold PLP-dependent enzyme [Syntrophotalea acetylenivorans]APG27173.1 cysteine desulfurase NifS [Syntrophotalea acetylenivorans]